MPSDYDLLNLTVPASVQVEQFSPETGPCVDQFITHDLPHNTNTADGIIRMYEANGAGVAINDLDNDGDLDLVLGNYDNPNSIFWNEGEPELPPASRCRSDAPAP